MTHEGMQNPNKKTVEQMRQENAVLAEQLAEKLAGQKNPEEEDVQAIEKSVPGLDNGVWDISNPEEPPTIH